MNEISADVQAERQRIVTEALGWGADHYAADRVTEALRAIGLGDLLPRTSAEVQVHVTGTVTVRTAPDGSVTQHAALYALETAVRQGRAVVEMTEVEPTGAPGAETPTEEPTAAPVA